MRQLFEGGVYFVGKPAESNDDWNRYVRMIQLGMIDAGSSACSACSPSQSSCQLWKRVLEHEQGLEIAQWASAAIISTRVRAPFEGGVYFARSYRLCGYNSREATIRGQGLVTPWMVPPQKRFPLTEYCSHWWFPLTEYPNPSLTSPCRVWYTVFSECLDWQVGQEGWSCLCNLC